MLTAEQSAALAASAATLRASGRAAFERDVAALLARGVALDDAIRLCVGIVPGESLPAQRRALEKFKDRKDKSATSSTSREG